LAAASTTRSVDRLGDVRSPVPTRILVGLSAVTFVGILYITSYANFFWDEWDFVTQSRPWTLDVFLLSHNEHWSTIPILIWKVLFIGVGLRSHIPYEAALLAVHVATVFLLFALIRRRSGDLPALAAALTLLVLGSGGTDIVWAFQIGFVGSVAFGLLAMVVLEGNPPFLSRLLLASAALLCSVMSSGVGLAFLVALGAELLLDPRRRRFLLALAVPIVAVFLWLLTYGAGVFDSIGSLRSADTPGGPRYVESLAAFVSWGLQATAGGVIGAGPIGAALLPVFATLLGWRWYRQGRLESWQVGMTAGLLAWFLLTGLGRAQNGPTAAGESRYVYVGVVFLLPLLAHMVRELPWRRLWRPALTAAFVLSLLGNIVQLWDRALVEPWSNTQPANATEVIRTENAELQTVEVFRGAPDMAMNRSLDPSTMPQLSAASYFAAIDELGSPVPSATPDTLRQLPWQAVDRVMVNLFGGAVTVTADSTRSTQGLQCRNVDLAAGASMDVQVPDGQSIMLQSSKGGDAFLFLGFLGPPTTEPLQHVHLQLTTPEWVYLPNTGKPTVWRLRIGTADMSAAKVCEASSPQAQQPTSVIYRAEGAEGKLDSAWSSVADSTAIGGHAAKASHGTFDSYQNDIFGSWIVPNQATYDVWLHVRVASPAGATPEMAFGLWDDQGQAWVGSTRYAPREIGTTYIWVKVAAGITPAAGHGVQFLASFTGRLGTDWFVDQAALTAP
jgi:hypothetical protein